eukprot:NODE_4902_length_440_cov_66.583120_g4242_i0.p3 GENE.NODE_4902_length_440_cov_66.583120_g4242_i0~~NODE_4902_length_440_cov_66.583120_g4242_i0.p3  ORF type:complete len:67 (-),score=13.91 NODE_4902_length_440_cov_66.583120_g4242_i0:5-205(-)
MATQNFRPDLFCARARTHTHTPNTYTTHRCTCPVRFFSLPSPVFSVERILKPQPNCVLWHCSPFPP